MRPVLDTAALHAMFAEQAAIGATPEGGLHRLAGSAEDGRVRDWLSAWMTDHGLRVHVDAVGNQLGVLELAGDGAPLMLAGSHLDSQPHGGRFDGAYGVVAACQAVAAISRAVAADAPAPACDVGVANWTSEEGARFQPSLLGSSVYTGALDAARARAVADGDGLRLAAALDRIGYSGDEVLPRAAAYVELHVECGPELEAAGRRIGVVRRWWGAIKATVELVGRQAHTGPTPMAQRRDALYAAGRLIVAVRALADDANAAAGAEILYSSVGRAEVLPNSPNVVPGRVRLWVELRSPEPSTLEAAGAALPGAVEQAAAAAGVHGSIVDRTVRPAGRFDARLVELADAVARERGHEPLPVDTIAAHDAVALAAILPSVVINVPSIGGLCHHPDERTDPEDLEAGAEVLLETLWRLCSDHSAP